MNQLLIISFCYFLFTCHSNTEKQSNNNCENTDTLKTEVKQQKNQPDTLLNTDDYLVLGNIKAKIKIVKDYEVDSFPDYNILIGYRDDVIIGQNIDYQNVLIYRKYKPVTSFEDYPAEIYKGKLADPDFSTDPSAKRFITRIKKECTNGINFAGHYTLVTWGCGSPCQSGVVVDRKTGRIYGGYGTAFGSKFKKNSRMIIRNIAAVDTTTNLIKVCAYCNVNHEIWTGTEFKEVE